MLVSPNVKGIVRDGRRGGYPLAELGVFGRYFRLGGPGFQNRHGSVVKGSEIYVSVGRHGGGIVATGRGDTLLEKHLLAGFCIVSSDQPSVFHQDTLATVYERGGDIRQPLGFLPEQVRSCRVSATAGQQGKDAALSLGRELEHRIPLLA